MIQKPFASKYVDNGRLFLRKHGYDFLANPNTTTVFEIIVPYNICKLDSVEILNCNVNDCVDFKVLDDDIGSLTTIPKQIINQYGYAVRMPEGFYKDQSKYEADLTGGMYLQITYNNKQTSAKTICVNIDFHEVVR